MDLTRNSSGSVPAANSNSALSVHHAVTGFVKNISDEIIFHDGDSKKN
jgi:hypothetical protein